MRSMCLCKSLTISISHLDPRPDNIVANKTIEVGKQRRRRSHGHRLRRNLSPNAIAVDEGKTSTALPPSPRSEESIQIVNGHIDGNSLDRNNFAVFDGPLDPSSNYTGFVEVIGEKYKVHDVERRQYQDVCGEVSRRTATDQIIMR